MNLRPVSTKWSSYKIDGVLVWVKRDDLCSPSVDDCPSFGKIRGLYAFLSKLPQGSVVGVLDTGHSQGGWATAYYCNLMGLRCINYYPVYKRELGKPDKGYPGAHKIRRLQLKAWALDAELRSLKAGMSAVLFNIAKKQLREEFLGATMVPNGLKLLETIKETAVEMESFPGPMASGDGTMIISASTATVAAGVKAGLDRLGFKGEFIVHLGYSRPTSRVREKFAGDNIRIIDEGYTYADEAKGIEAPFPCNKYYDLKAWKWLVGNVTELKRPVAFWNVGS